jgi:N-acyl-D-amino-acid deacylase
MATYDLVIRGATVYDGTGGAPFVADVAVQGDRIAAVGQVPELGAVERPAAGLRLAPGFIDVHAHDDFAALLQPELPYKLLQGVTTVVVGNCGMGAAPFRPALELARSFEPECQLPRWEGYAGYLGLLEAAPPSANIAVLAGHNAMRAEVMGTDGARAATAQELSDMQALLEEALSAGVLGLSTGLVYEPGRHAEPEELVALTRRLGPRGLYTTHLRSEGSGLLAAVEEALHVAEESGAGLQLSHHKASGRSSWGRVVDSLARVDAARRQGVDVWLDAYPYTAGSTLLSNLVARGALEARDGALELRPEDVVVSAMAAHPELEGASLARLAEEWQTSAAAAAERLLVLERSTWVIAHSMCEQDVRRVLQHPAVMIGSDGIPQRSGRPHPRLAGAFPRVFCHYAEREGVLTPETAVWKMTGLPATRFGLQDRGRIASGCFADLILFSPEFRDRATFDDPRQSPAGVHAVYVNGRVVVQDGVHLGTRPGRVLRRAA